MAQAERILTIRVTVNLSAHHQDKAAVLKRYDIRVRAINPFPYPEIGLVFFYKLDFFQ